MAEPKSVVFVVDDDTAIREMLNLMLTTVGYECKTYSGAKQFLEEVNEQSWGCLLLDIRMPEMSGLALQAVLNSQGINLPIIFITAHADVTMAVEAMHNGAFDFIQKPFREQNLLDSIGAALAQPPPSPISLLRQQDLEKRINKLTPREYEIMMRIADGQPNKVIAIDLGIAQGTVEIHRARVMNKMKAQSLPHLMRILMAAGKLNLEDI